VSVVIWTRALAFAFQRSHDLIDLPIGVGEHPVGADDEVRARGFFVGRQLREDASARVVFGQPPVDDKNPDPGKRSRKILGIQIFAMEQNATGSWTGGIYNSDDGKTYDGRLSPQGEDGLEVQGCAGSLCGSEVWTRTK